MNVWLVSVVLKAAVSNLPSNPKFRILAQNGLFSQTFKQNF